MSFTFINICYKHYLINVYTQRQCDKNKELSQSVNITESHESE